MLLSQRPKTETRNTHDRKQVKIKVYSRDKWMDGYEDVENTCNPDSFQK